jgi:hypothetical protein
MSETEQIIEQKPSRGAPKHNQNASKHSLWAARRALNEYGLRAIDGRSALGFAIRQFRAEIVRDLGGEDSLSAQKKAVLDIVVREKLLLDGLDAWILLQPSLVDRRKRALLPVVKERQALASAFVEHLAMLGLDKRTAAVPDLHSYLAGKRSKELGATSPAALSVSPPSDDAAGLEVEDDIDSGGRRVDQGKR